MENHRIFNEKPRELQDDAFLPHKNAKRWIRALEYARMRIVRLKTRTNVIGFFPEFIVRSRCLIRGFDEPTSVYVPPRNPVKMKNRKSR